MPVQSHGCGRGSFWVRCRDVTFYSCSLTPKEPFQKCHDIIDLMNEKQLVTTVHIIDVGGFNIRAVECGVVEFYSTNPRGKYTLNSVSRAGLFVLTHQPSGAPGREAPSLALPLRMSHLC